MEIKCDICGTINDGSTNFCKGCFQKLDAERKQNIAPEETNVSSVIENEEVQEVPWNNNEEIEEIASDTPEIDDWEPLSVNGDVIKNNDSEDISDETAEETDNEIQEEKITEESPVEVAKEDIQEEIVDEHVEDTSGEMDGEVQIEQSSEEVIEESTMQDNVEIDESATEELGESTDENIIEKTTEEVTETTEVVEENNEEVQEEQPVEDAVDDSWELPAEEEIQPVELPEQEEIIEPIGELDESMEAPISPIPELGEDPVKTEVDDWSNDPIEEAEETRKEPKYILKFILTYLISMFVVFGTLVLTTKYLNNIFDNVTSNIVSFALYRLASLLTLIFSTFITFRKKAPGIEKMNSVTFKILGFVAIPSILIQLFILGFVENTKVLMFVVGIMLSLIILVIFFGHIRNTIKKKNEAHLDDKVFFVYGIINIVLIIGLLGFGIYARSNSLDMPKINFLYNIFNNTKEDKEIIEKFIAQVQLKILENQATNENYVFPAVMNDVNDAAYDEYTPDEINLQLNEDGAITGGTITYRGIIYTYDGEKIEVK